MPEKRYSWILLASLWIIALIGALPRFVMAFYQGQIAEDLNVSRSFVSFSWSFNLFITAVCLPLGGWLVDRHGAKKILFISRMLGGLGAAITYFSHDSSTFFFLGYGFLFALTGLAATTEFSLLFHWFREKRGTANTILKSASPLGLAILSPLFALYRDRLSWQDAFFATAFLALLVVLPLIYFVVQDPPFIKKQQPMDKETGHSFRERILALRQALSSPILCIVILALFTCGFNMGTVEMNLVAIHDTAHVPSHEIGCALALMGLLDVTGSFAFGYLLDRYSRLIVLSLLYLFRTVGFLLLSWHLPVSPLLFSLFFGTTYVGAVPGSLLVANEYYKESGSLTGSLLLVHSAAGILSASAGGLVYDACNSYDIIILVNCGLCLATAAGYAFSAVRKPVILSNT